ncbi:hypothetical protein CAPTEDRAFT_93478 [Capitella teleta]|uniref:RING-type domain-containing protein n=1 Tax=Capitella teleta TaxID=283909 RepID=R7TW23_CAPTE|nr:hypothetical protein CAPTEDRAFT_93478 [Capitella teleta]|eukprot:ELT95195.1 hypothetical protein CAPTEDRAFT_93478 [Capitella teleta]
MTEVHAIKPIELAKAGFFYLGWKAGYQCAFCDGHVLNWLPYEDPDTRHAILFPACAFVKKKNHARKREYRHKKNKEITQAACTESPFYSKMRQQNSDFKTADTCTVCFLGQREVVFQPCAHLVCCKDCAQCVKNCPVCRGMIKDVIKIFR